MKSTGGKSQRREEKKKKDQRRERVRRQKTQVREKVEKSRITVFFQWFVAQEGRKVGSLERRVRRHLAGWEMKNCTPFAKHIWKSKVLKTDGLGALAGIELSKKCTPLCRKAHFEVKNVKTNGFRPLLEVEMFKKYTPLGREARSQKC